MKKKTWKSFAGVGGFLLIGGVSVSYIANANDVAIMDFETLRNAVMKKVEGKTSSTPIVNASNSSTQSTTFSLEDLTALYTSSIEHSQKSNLKNAFYIEDAKSTSVIDHVSTSYNGSINNPSGSYSSNQGLSQNQKSNSSQPLPSITSLRSSAPYPTTASAQPIAKPINNEPKLTTDPGNKKPSADNKSSESTSQKPERLSSAGPVISTDHQECVEEKSNQVNANKSNSNVCITKDKQNEGDIVNTDNQTNTNPVIINESSSQPKTTNEPKIIFTENQSSESMDLGVKTEEEKSTNIDSLVECDTDLSKCGLISSATEISLTGLLPANFENDLSATGIPLPSSLWLVTLGAACFLVRRRQPLNLSNG